MSTRWHTGTLRKLSDEERDVPACAQEGYCWVVEQPYSCATPEGLTVTVPVGFLTDGSTGGPDVGCAWLFHDWLYATHAYDDGSVCTQAEADALMSDILKADRMSAYDAVFSFLRWAFCCRCFLSRAWRASGARGPHFLHDVISREEEHTKK